MLATRPQALVITTSQVTSHVTGHVGAAVPWEAFGELDHWAALQKALPGMMAQ